MRGELLQRSDSLSLDDRATIPIAIVAGVRIYREGLEAILDHESAFSVVGTARGYREARTLVSRERPSVLLIDVALENACALTLELTQSDPAPAVLALGADEKDVIRFAETGATGFITQEDGLRELVRIARGALQGELCCSPRIAHLLLRRVSRLGGSRRPQTPSSDPEDLLTARQREVAQLLAFALSNKEIAARLCIEESTVKNHVHTILEKLQLRRREEVIVRLKRKASSQSLAGRPDIRL